MIFDNLIITIANTRPCLGQSFALDAVGNQTAVTTDGTTADRTANSQNELTGVGAFTLTYDNDGNTTLDQNGNVMTYDAWNRMVSDNNVTTNQAMIYSYDANGRQITEQNTVLMSDGPILIVNNGSAQRSMIDSLTLVFDHPVTLSSGAITLVGASNGDITISISNPSSDQETYLITFSGSEISAGSLPNDVYTLSVTAADVTYVATGSTLTSDLHFVFARLVGDANGDGVVDAPDVTALGETYGTLANPALDFYGDGTVNFDDLSLMAETYGDSVSFTPGNGRIYTAPSSIAPDAGDISPWVAGTTAPITDLYYSSQGQVIEEHAASVVTAQNVWNIDYVNDLLLRDDNSASGSLGIADSGLGNREYAQHDANFNITSFTSATGGILQRFVYSPYGVQTALNPNWTLSYAPNSIYGFQGGRYDAATGLLHFGERDYDPATATWIEQDPAGYIDGPNRYQALDASPIDGTDSSGENTHASGGAYRRPGVQNGTKEPIIVERDNGIKQPLSYIVLLPGETAGGNLDWDYVFYKGDWWKIKPGFWVCAAVAFKDNIVGGPSTQTIYQFDGRTHGPQNRCTIFRVKTDPNVWYPGKKGEVVPFSVLEEYLDSFPGGSGGLLPSGQ